MPENSTSEKTSENPLEPLEPSAIARLMQTFSDRRSRPVLMGGLGLSAGLALWNGLSSGGAVSIAEDGFTTIGLCALGVGAWLWRRGVAMPTIKNHKPTGDRQAALDAITQLRVAIARLQAELDRAIVDGNKDVAKPEKPTGLVDSANSADTLEQIQAAIARWQTEGDTLTQSLDRQTLTIAVVGAPWVGKSAIVQGLKTAIETGWLTQIAPMNPGLSAIVWDELTIRAAHPARDVTASSATPLPWLTRSPDQTFNLTPSFDRALRVDCVLYAIAGDLTASERRDLEQFDRAGQTTIVLWNKSDQVSATDRERVLGSIRHQLADFIPADRILALAAAPRGGMAPNFQALTAALEQIAIAPAQERIWQQIQRASHLTIAEIKLSLDRLRRHRAEPIVRRYQWIAAAAVTANPVPSLDLLALGSIGTQLLIDLGQIYQRDLSLDRARAGFEAIVEMLLKLGLVELSTQAIAVLLKSHPVTFLAGSAAQGLSAAYLIQIIGTSAIAYFETQDAESFDSIQSDRANRTNPTDDEWDRSRFQAILSQTIATTQRTAVLQSLLKRAASHFAIASPEHCDQTAIEPNSPS